MVTQGFEPPWSNGQYAHTLVPLANVMFTGPRKASRGQRVWGVSTRSLLYRCRKLDLLTDSAAGRAYQRLDALQDQPGFRPEPVEHFPGEQPAMLQRAFDLASEHGDITIGKLAEELAWHPAHVRQLLGLNDSRPVLRLVE